MKKLIAATLASISVFALSGYGLPDTDVRSDAEALDTAEEEACYAQECDVCVPTEETDDFTQKPDEEYVEDIDIDILTTDSYVEPDFSEAEAELIARLVLAEAEGESELGKRLVIDTVLNRVESEYFPDTVFEVIYEPWQFTPVYNGRLDAMEVCRDIVDMVYEELISRTDAECVFFQAGWYSPWGISLYQEGGHYFSKCKYE